MMGRRKAAVLPVPVAAVPMTSGPASAGGMACAWMGVGCSKPAAVTARSEAGERPRAWKSRAETGSVDTSENYLLSSREDRPDETHATETGREVAASYLPR